MATYKKRTGFPSGYKPEDFKYQGRPSLTEGDFKDGVGIADLACVNQFGDVAGDRNNNKFYHAGVCQTPDGVWWLYTEWGRLRSDSGRSWQGSTFHGGDWMLVSYSSETEARKAFAKKVRSKNLARLEKKTIAGIEVYAAKVDSKGKVKDAYIVRPLATRSNGFPDAYTIKDHTGVKEIEVVVTKETSSRKTFTYQSQVTSLVTDLLGGTSQYARAATESTGITPTLGAIEQVRNEYIPAALQLISNIGPELEHQIQDKGLQDLSKLVAAKVPRPIPDGDMESRSKAVILSQNNILALQADLDAYESALQNEDFEVTSKVSFDCDSVMNAKLRWIDPNSEKGKWIAQTFWGMSNDRHGYVGQQRIKNIFEIDRPDRDKAFVESVHKVASLRKGNFSNFARLQPKERPDLKDLSEAAKQANVFLGFHGTRAVNVAPILQGNLRLPKQLKGVFISGAAFGHGIYAATDWRKSYGYTGRGYWGNGGTIPQRGWFMFMQDIIMGNAYMTKTTGSWNNPPKGYDSIAAFQGITSVQNDEHIFFNPSYQRMRYLIEGDAI